MPKLSYVSLVIVAHAFNTSAWEVEAGAVSVSPGLSKRASFRTHSKTTEKPCLKKTKLYETEYLQKYQYVSFVLVLGIRTSVKCV